MKQNSTPFDAAEYDKQIKRTLPFYEEMVLQIIDIVRLLDLQSLMWLDVGCGTGEIARITLDNFDIKKMVCIDVEKEMLEKAGELCNDEKVEFLQTDVRDYFPVTIPESMEILRSCGFRMVEVLWVSYMQVGILARK